MIRHILLWKYREGVNKEDALKILKDSVDTLKDIDGVRSVEINPNLEENAYDLVFYSEFKDRQSLINFKTHPLHVAHAKRCANLVTDRLGADVECEDKI